MSQFRLNFLYIIFIKIIVQSTSIEIFCKETLVLFHISTFFYRLPSNLTSTFKFLQNLVLHDATENVKLLHWNQN